MALNLFPLLSYVLISTFTPGPSNISSASLGVQRGYRHSLRFQGGLAVGVFVLMLLAGLISASLLKVFPILEPILRYAGAAYILYLAVVILKASYSFSEQSAQPSSFAHGLTLQVLNPKLTVYAFTLFSTFLAPIASNLALVPLAAALLAATSFGATSLWTIAGTAIKTYLHNARLKAIVNILLSLSLVYAAIALTGLI
jgi:cysteine/O-acetylserine efflux protein